jgi:hypothetical protein
VEPQEEEEIEATNPPVETPERSLKKGCVPFSRELRAFASQMEVNQGQFLDADESENKENNIDNKCILSFKVVNK